MKELIYLYPISRLKQEVEKQELELFRQGQFIIEDEEKEDANASADRPIPPDISVEVRLGTAVPPQTNLFFVLRLRQPRELLVMEMLWFR